jgi:NADH-quinone oxidoreductase subunit M
MSFCFESLLVFAIIIPLVLGVGLLFVSGLSDGLVKGLSLFGFVMPSVMACCLWGISIINPAQGAEYLFLTNWNTGLEALGISLKLGLNGISMPLFLMASLVGVAAGVYAVFSGVKHLRYYVALLLIMLGSLMGVFASIDLFFFYFFHEIALIPAFVMIGIWGSQGRAFAAIEMAIYLTIGAMLSLVGLLMLYLHSGAESFDIISLKSALSNIALTEFIQKYSYGFLLFGFGILVSLWPFHSWAPRAYGVASTSVAMMHAGVLKKFGLYGLIQIGAPFLPYGANYWGDVLVWLALGNILIIGLITIAQYDVKKMIGYSSVMHIGYIFLGIACVSKIGAGGAVMLMFGHGLSVSLLFLLSKCIYDRTLTFNLNEMGGLAMHAPMLGVFFVAAVMASIGLPGFANFWGEISIFIGLWSYNWWVALAAVVGIVISAVYGLRAVACIFFGSVRLNHESKITDLRVRERIPALILFVALLVVGFWPKSVSHSLNKTIEVGFSMNEQVMQK